QAEETQRACAQELAAVDAGVPQERSAGGRRHRVRYLGGMGCGPSLYSGQEKSLVRAFPRLPRPKNRDKKIRHSSFSGNITSRLTNDAFWRRLLGYLTMPRSQMDPVLRFVRTLAAPRDTLALADQELLERFRHRNDQAAFATLVRRHGPMVLRLCLRITQNEH